MLTHGFTLDEQGRKMSSRSGMSFDPSVVIEGGKNQKQDPPYGADVLGLLGIVGGLFVRCTPG